MGNGQMNITTTQEGKCGCNEKSKGWASWMGDSLSLEVDTQESLDPGCKKSGQLIRQAKVTCSSEDNEMKLTVDDEGECQCNNDTDGWEDWMKGTTLTPGDHEITPKCVNEVETIAKTTCESTVDGIKLTNT